MALTQTEAQVQVDLNAVAASNAGLTSISDLSDTTATAGKKSGFHSIQASSTEAPNTERAVLISAVRNTTASGEIRYSQIALTEANKLFWATDDGGTLSDWQEAAGVTATQTLTNKTIDLTSNTLNGTLAEFNTAISDASVASLAGTETLTNKTVNLASNTVSMTLAQLNTAVGDATIASTTNAVTLTNKTVTFGANTITLTLAELNTAVTDASIASLAGTETLTNKTIDFTDNSVTGTLAEFNTAVSDATLVGTTATQTLTNKTVNLTSNTLVTSLAQLNTAVSDASVASLAGVETLTNKTLAEPTLTGDVPLSTGDIVIGTSGKGVDFTAATGDDFGTVTSSLLDSFKEGVYTATILGSSSGNYGMSSSTLAYQKIGNVCHVQGTLVVDTDNSLSGDCRILLPFTSANLAGIAGRTVGTIALNANGSSFESPGAFINEGLAYFVIHSYPSDGTSAVAVLGSSNSDAAFTIGVNFSYFTA